MLRCSSVLRFRFATSVRLHSLPFVKASFEAAFPSCNYHVCPHGFPRRWQRGALRTVPVRFRDGAGMESGAEFGTEFGPHLASCRTVPVRSRVRSSVRVRYAQVGASDVMKELYALGEEAFVKEAGRKARMKVSGWKTTRSTLPRRRATSLRQSTTLQRWAAGVSVLHLWAFRNSTPANCTRQSCCACRTRTNTTPYGTEASAAG